MGLLKGVGRRLKGLFGEDGFADTFAEAQAWLDGDYGRAMALAERNRRRKRRPGEAMKAKAEPGKVQWPEHGLPFDAPYDEHELEH